MKLLSLSVIIVRFIFRHKDTLSLFTSTQDPGGLMRTSELWGLQALAELHFFISLDSGLKAEE